MGQNVTIEVRVTQVETIDIERTDPIGIRNIYRETLGAMIGANLIEIEIEIPQIIQ